MVSHRVRDECGADPDLDSPGWRVAEGPRDLVTPARESRDGTQHRLGGTVVRLRRIPHRFLLVFAPSASNVWLQHYPVGCHLWFACDLQAESVLRDGIDGEGAELVHQDAATCAVLEAEEDLTGVGWHQLAHQRR